MKKQFFRHVPAMIAALALSTTLNAQSENTIPELSNATFITSETTASRTSFDEGSTAHINTRALKDFSKSFKNAVNTDWWKIKYGWLARFEAAGVKTRVFYDKNGRWTSTILTYCKDKLPKDVLKQVSSVYYDYEIYLVNEIITGEGTAWLVAMQDADGYKTIRVAGDTMDVYEEFKKLQ